MNFGNAFRFENNFVHHNQLAMPDLRMNNDSIAANNHFDHCGRICIAAWTTQRSAIVRNRFSAVYEFHSQAISLYLADKIDSTDLFVAGNEFTDMCEEFTTNYGVNAVLYNNLFHSRQDMTPLTTSCGSHTWGHFDGLVAVNNFFMQGCA